MMLFESGEQRTERTTYNIGVLRAMLNRIDAAQVSDTTGDDKRTESW